MVAANEGITRLRRAWGYALVIVVCLVAGYGVGAHSKSEAIRQAQDEADQLAAARAYIHAMSEGDWNQFASSASGYVWPGFLLTRAQRTFDPVYGIGRAREPLKRASNLRVGPPLSRQFLMSAFPFELLGIPQQGWPDWNHPPRAVLYDVDRSTYFIFVIWESGGWHAFGCPLRLKEKYLKSGDLPDAFTKDSVTKGG